MTARSRASTHARWAAAVALAGLAVWLSVRQVQWDELLRVLAGTRPGLVALALLTVLATTLAKAARWSVLLRPCRVQISPPHLLRVLFIGQMANGLLPRLGDLARAVILGPHAQGRVPAVLGTLLAEKALDGVMGLLILAGLALWAPLPTWMRGPTLGLLALTALLLLVLAWAARHRVLGPGFSGLLARHLPAGVQARLRELLSGLALGLGLLKAPRHALAALGFSGLIWGLAAATNVVTLAALGIGAPAWTTWLVLVTGYAATFLPTVPTQVGVFEYAAVLSLTAAGVEPEPALAFGLVLHLLVQGPATLFGPLSMAAEGLSWRALRVTSGGATEGEIHGSR